MRIGFDSKRLFFNNSGLGNYARFHAETMQGIEAFESLWLCEKEAHYRTLQSVSPKRAWPGFRSWGMGRFALKQGADLYHGLSNELPLDWPANKPSVLTVHDTIFLDHPDYYKPWDRSLYSMKLRSAMNRATVVVATSEFTRQSLLNHFPKRTDIRVMYQGLSQDFLDSAKRVDAQAHASPYFVYHSTFNARKNHRTLIHAFSKIWKQCDWDLVLIGRPGSEWKDLQNLVNTKSWGERIHFVLDASQDDLLSWLKGASGFVYPSFTEGFGIPLIEAQHLNLPIAASRIPVFQELMEEGALYFHPNNAEEMAAAMLELCRKETQIKLIEKAQAVSAKWDSQALRSQWESLYKGLSK
jgi:glycosyltransferase involved in cell wall biosynthesis